jgi:hypothetical protein
MLPFGVTIPATVPQRSEIPEGFMNYPVFKEYLNVFIHTDDRHMNDSLACSKYFKRD